MRNRYGFFLLIAALILGLAACSSEEETSPAAQTTAADETVSQAAATEPSLPEATETPADSSVDAARAAGEPESSGIAVAQPSDAFGRAQTALNDLESYRYRTSFLFVGEEDGDVESGSMELVGEIAGADRTHLVLRNLYEAESFEVIRIGDTAWILDDEAWEEVPILVAEAMSQAALVFAPAVTWNGLFGELSPDAGYVGKDVVNGIPVDHYTATYTQWGNYWPGELIDATGDVWIAEAGYPVRYHFSATGINAEGNRGAITWAMELSDVGVPISIEPPM